VGADNPDRIRTLDLIRGVAVLGILAVNIASFAAPASAIYSPDMPRPGHGADHAAWLLTFIVFEGKMRALFSMLFGASLLLFVERLNLTGRDGARLQLRRLVWLLLFGYLHFALIWDGDILFLYAAVGLVALALHNWRPVQLVTAAALVLALWQVWGAAMWLPSVATEMAASGAARTPLVQKQHAQDLAQFRASDARDLAEARLSWPAQVGTKLTEHGGDPLGLVVYNCGETLPWMLLGMALLRGGLFAGTWPRLHLIWLVVGGLGLGAAATAAFASWATRSGYPEVTMHFAVNFGLALPHLAMALGYAALVVLAAPGVLRSAPGQMLEAAGRMAFSNYLGTSLVMATLSYGGAALDPGAAGLGTDAGVERTVAGAVPPRAAGMAVAQFDGVENTANPKPLIAQLFICD
jgi:uncharacterized protein